MAQNTSSAVMQQRVEPDDSLDDFPTPSWSARALIEHVVRPSSSAPGTNSMVCWEPAANRGYMVRGLRDYFARVYASDIYDYGHGAQQHDFLMPFVPGGADPTHWIITNPPFRLAEQFVTRAINVARNGVAIIVRTSFLEGGDRYNRLFSVRPPTIVAQHAERVIMTKGIVRDPSREYWDDAAGKMRRPSTATSYCWLIWLAGRPRIDTRMMWIPPCRKAMERPGDYPTEDSDAIHCGEDTDGTLETAARRADREAETLCGSRAQHQEAEPVAGGPEIAADPTA